MKKNLATFALIFTVCTLWAVPARRDPFPVEQPNGDTLMVQLVGDERWHAYYTIDGLLIVQNDEGYYCYAKWGDEYVDRLGITRRRAVATKKIAKNADKRTKCENRWLKRHKIVRKENLHS